MNETLIFNLIGLLCGVIGTLLIIFSTKIIKFEGIRFSGTPATVTDINQKKFRSGLIFILIGFLLQIIPILSEIYFQ